MGVYAFRKGSLTPCLSTILGGNGCNAWPTVSVAKAKNSKGEHFVKAGEIWIAGNREFNPMAPWYAGDDGLIHPHILPAGQKRFHVFGECGSLTQYPYGHHHGDAVNGMYIYLGVYELDDEQPAGSISFQQFGMYNAQWIRTEYYWTHKKISNPYEKLPEGNPEHSTAYQEWNGRQDWMDMHDAVTNPHGFTREFYEAADSMSVDQWQKKVRERMEHGGFYDDDEPDAEPPDSKDEADKFAFQRYLRKRNRKYWLQRIKCVGYDMELYRALRDARCGGNTPKGRNARVETELEKLGYL